MKLEVGKYYETKNGRKVGPMRAYGSDLFDWHDDDDMVGSSWIWEADGSGIGNVDLISEWISPTGPVITETVTRKRIVPGVYGKVRVNHHAGGMVQLQFQGSNLTSSVKFTRAELIATRDILSQLIDAMEDV